MPYQNVRGPFYWPFQGSASFVVPFCYLYVSRLYVFYCLVCSMQPCDHLLAKGWSLDYLVCDVSLCFVNFPYYVYINVWYLIVSIPDLCLLFYLYTKSTFSSFVYEITLFQSVLLVAWVDLQVCFLSVCMLICPSVNIVFTVRYA